MTDDLDAYLRRTAVLVLRLAEEHRTDFDRLDNVAADGDHGTTFVLAWRQVVAAVPEDDTSDPADTLRSAAEAFASVGGSIGPLWGLALLEASRAVAAGGRDPADAAAALEAAIAGMQRIGKSRPGDKTLLDAAAPAVEAFRAAVDGGASASAALDAARGAARAGMAHTATLEARRGRASRLPDRARGHVDAGAASMSMFWEVAARGLGLPEREITDLGPDRLGPTGRRR